MKDRERWWTNNGVIKWRGTIRCVDFCVVRICEPLKERIPVRRMFTDVMTEGYGVCSIMTSGLSVRLGMLRGPGCTCNTEVVAYCLLNFCDELGTVVR